MNVICDRISRLRGLMKERRIDAYLVPTSDYHSSEYVGEHFACRAYITGFTGSAGTALITRDWAGLWTDGRYFVQAAGELKDTGVELMKMGEPGVPTLFEKIQEVVPKFGILGFDGRVLNAREGEQLQEALARKKASVAWTEALIGEIWNGRPPLSAEPVWILDEIYAGKSAADKIAGLRETMHRQGADLHILTSLDDIAWLLNIRGNDTPCNPVVLSYLAVTRDEILFFVNGHALSGAVREYLTGLGVALRPYAEIYSYCREVKNRSVLLEKDRVNYAICLSLSENNRIVDMKNPTTLAKCVKNPTEIRWMRAAHIKDGAALTRFIYWLKKNVGRTAIDERGAADLVDEYRAQIGSMQPSFDTISAYGPNAAMCHYHARRGACAALEPKGLYLVDSGGQYLEGTTDVTRTIALGELTQEEKEHYTLVLISMLRLGAVRFPRGCTGLTLDYAAREVFWQRGLDYNHGTGHGVGFSLNVHEDPVRIRYRATGTEGPFEEGMICSDEPGIYIEGSHGIRTENLMVCVKDEETPFGQFYRFEYLTCVPIDLAPVLPELMSDEDIKNLNDYHAWVRESLFPLLNEEEQAWLAESCRPLARA